MKLEDLSIHAWIQEHQIRTETGAPLDFRQHTFLFDPYRDESPDQVILKAAQIGFSTLAILKSLWFAKKRGMDIIYTLPTEADRNQFVGGKVNRIVAQNPVLQQYVKDKDSIEQKQVGDNLIHYRGTWTSKAAIMVSSDLNIYDEVDASKQDVIEQYSTRLQHSPYKYEWYFSHPSAPGTGVDRPWQLSDQKHWFVKCRCGVEQFLSWPHSVDVERRVFACKSCSAEVTDAQRRKGRWVQKYRQARFSGYWIPLLICPWVSAPDIVSYHETKGEEYFYNKVLGLPYVGGGNKLTKQLLMQNLTPDLLVPLENERVVIGVDTGKRIHLVCGTQKGIFYYSIESGYEELEHLLNRWPKAIAVIDQGGDLIGSRQLRERFPGRVFLCSFGEDRKTQELVRWGRNDEDGAVIADRNRMIQLVVDEFTDRRIPLQGTEADWYDYWLHWNALTRVTEVSEHGDRVRKIWARNGEDHWALATAYWRVGMMRFGAGASSIINPKATNLKPSYEINPDGTTDAQFRDIIRRAAQKPRDWRSLP